MHDLNSKIILCGGAGLVGQNLTHMLIQHGYKNITVIDKHESNLSILKNYYPEINIINANLALSGEWEASFKEAKILVMLQAQVGGKNPEEFNQNSLETTKKVLRNFKKYEINRLIHISSSVVKSSAKDFYSNTKRQQEMIIQNSGIACPILRPTLMFGLFDRKHLGWLSRFMKKAPIFPIPGKGDYLRQPLYVKDFCKIIISCMRNNNLNGVFNISGLETVNYIDIICQIKKAVNSKTLVIKIPYRIFFLLIKIWSLFDKNPPFTTQQLEALVVREEFEIIDWPEIFEVQNTPYVDAMNETFRDSIYSKVKLDF